MNSKEEQTNSEVTNSKNEVSIKKEKDSIYSKEETEDKKLDETLNDIDDEYKFGWSSYSEITN